MKKKTFKKLLFLGGTAALLLSGTSYYLHIHSPEHTMNTAQKSSTQKTKKTKEKAEVLLDVPLESQFDSPSLENGCEVTSLSMLLSFYGYEITKNQLAEQLDYVPVFNADGTHGDPNEGFVGDISGGDWAMGVYVPPVASLAQQIVQTDYHTFPKTDAQLDDIKKALSKGNPVWTSVTINFEVPDETDFMTWTTNNGEVRVTPLVHACVVTGYDKENIYVNDPYGVKNRAVPINDFSAIFTAMGGQMLTLEKS
ncbi:C39 family peptidase [Enterococcus faecium]|uniref:C39 family peptidase n=1 Tax=Enterococcus TaxID=1350 RepID=UPI000CF10749|nr:C39 family peptidase [Enterococcus faecium]EGP5220364.1 peptidase C39 [Enterococcus faecium]MBE9862141.1 peptidase C39 [Enterococcus faecium]MCD5053172.1 C39 family peptidase [Enterococcus faecium]MCD5112197.1 C39 family peptidase [Enterococcus faecium]MCD5227193.1 C39 family peptidase [Enterococcus faecium]